MANPMTKKQTIVELARLARVTAKQAQALLEGLASLAVRGAAEGGFVIPGLCKISVVERKARQCRNPRTGSTVFVPARKAIRFRAVKSARDAVAQGIHIPVEAVGEPGAEAAPEPIFITFRCTSCGAEVEAATELAEQMATCPGCGIAIKVPSTASITEFAQIEQLKEEVSKVVRAAPASQKAEDEDWRKGSTIRIEVPESYHIPRAVKRTIYIRRRKG